MYDPVAILFNVGVGAFAALVVALVMGGHLRRARHSRRLRTTKGAEDSALTLEFLHSLLAVSASQTPVDARTGLAAPRGDEAE